MNMGFEPLTAVHIEVTVVWVVTCCMAVCYQCFAQTFCLHLEGENGDKRVPWW